MYVWSSAYVSSVLMNILLIVTRSQRYFVCTNRVHRITITSNTPNTFIYLPIVHLHIQEGFEVEVVTYTDSVMYTEGHILLCLPQNLSGSNIQKYVFLYLINSLIPRLYVYSLKTSSTIFFYITVGRIIVWVVGRVEKIVTFLDIRIQISDLYTVLQNVYSTSLPGVIVGRIYGLHINCETRTISPNSQLIRWSQVTPVC